ncbi:MAG TPA: transcriptional regulator [Streptosporangiaceae bacterium]|nr:transcriptional regulator [Streptosporangiaceae bacterium]
MSAAGRPATSGRDTGGPDTTGGPDNSGPDTSGLDTTGPAAHPTNGIDDLVHQRHRLGILTITAEAQRADFGYLREALSLTAGNLSRHLTVLEEAGLIQVEKGYEGRKPRTRVRITRQGRAALATELAALTELLHRHQRTTQPG